jgi:dolichol-phosphate mannosyltransferase
MRSTQDRVVSVRTAIVSLILPITPGSTLADSELAKFRRILEEEAGFQSVEVVIARTANDASRNGQSHAAGSEHGRGDLTISVSSESADWPGLVRAGLDAATGEYLVVLDVNRAYSPESLVRVLDCVRKPEIDLAVAVPSHGSAGFLTWVRSRPGPALISRMMLGTSDIFSGLFAMRRYTWDTSPVHRSANGSSVVLDSLLRRQARCVDVPVTVDSTFQPGRIGLKDLRPLKRILDGQFGNYSRLVQFCIVGASGMVVDLSLYALLQFLLSYTWLAERNSAIFGGSWHLALAAAMSIGIALVWNFTLNRRLTFNDATKEALLRQFFTYALSNALGIVFSFSLRLYLPAHVGFFARHRLAAAVVGIVAATGISFTMARWVVFSRRPDLRTSAHFPHEHSAIDQPTSVP